MIYPDCTATVALVYEKKCLCVFVLDVSNSMKGTLMKILNEGLVSFFYESILKDKIKSKRIEISIITFNEHVNIIQEPVSADNIVMPPLVANGCSLAMVNAVDEAIAKVKDWKYGCAIKGKCYYTPWIVLITNSEINELQDTNELSLRIENDTFSKYHFVPLTIEGINIKLLKESSLPSPMWGLEEANFRNYFKWLSCNIGTDFDLYNFVDWDYDTINSWMNNCKV